MKQSDEKLLKSLARATVRLVSKLNAQELTNTVWAFVTVRVSDEELLMSEARAAERLLGDLNE